VDKLAGQAFTVTFTFTKFLRKPVADLDNTFENWYILPVYWERLEPIFRPIGFYAQLTFFKGIHYKG